MTQSVVTVLVSLHELTGRVPATHVPGLRLCDKTHAIREEPRSTYFDRYPKAVGRFEKNEKVKWLCQQCADRGGWTLKFPLKF